MFPLQSILILKWTDLYVCDSHVVDLTDAFLSRQYRREYHRLTIGSDVAREKELISVRICKHFLLSSAIVIIRNTSPLTKVSANSLSTFLTISWTEQMPTLFLRRTNHGICSWNNFSVHFQNHTKLCVLHKCIIYSHNRKAGCLSNGILKIIVTKPRDWSFIIMTSYLSENLRSKINVKS